MKSSAAHQAIIILCAATVKVSSFCHSPRQSAPLILHTRRTSIGATIIPLTRQRTTRTTTTCSSSSSSSSSGATITTALYATPTSSNDIELEKHKNSTEESSDLIINGGGDDTKLPIVETTPTNDVQTVEEQSSSSSKLNYTYKQLTAFVATTVCIWLSEPILSLVDTAVVGKTSSTLELAALGPATMVFDSAVYLIYFLAISTTNILSRALAKGDTVEGLYEQRKTVSHALGLAATIGLFIMLLVGGPFGLPLLQWVAGSGNQMVVPAALSYNRIRSISAPASILGMVAQAAALASLDTKTPAVAVIVASTLNIVGDVLLCVFGDFGIRGAAFATAFASVASCAVLLVNLRRRLQKKLNEFADKRREGVIGTGTEASVALVEKEIERLESVPFMSLPDKKSLREFIRLAGPIFFVIVGKLVCYSAMTFQAASYGLMELAAHNVMLRVFFFFSTFGDSLSQAAQSFIPSIAYRNVDGDDAVDGGKAKTMQLIRRLMKRFMVMATVISIVNSSFGVYLLKNQGHVFTRELGITSVMSKMSGWMGASLILHPFIMLCEGSIIAKRDLKYLVGMYAATMGIMLAQLRTCTLFEGVWRAFFLFQVVRLTQFGWRTLNQTFRLRKDTHKEQRLSEVEMS